MDLKHLTDDFLPNLLTKKVLLTLVCAVLFVENYLLLLYHVDLTKLDNLAELLRPSVGLLFLCVLALMVLLIFPLLHFFAGLASTAIPISDTTWEVKKEYYEKYLTAEALREWGFHQHNVLALQEYEKYNRQLKEKHLIRNLCGALFLLTLANWGLGSFWPSLTTKFSNSHPLSVCLVLAVLFATGWVYMNGIINHFDEFTQVRKPKEPIVPDRNKSVA